MFTISIFRHLISGELKTQGVPFSNRVDYEDIILMEKSVITTTTKETYTGDLLTVKARGANFYCIEGILPEQSAGEKNNRIYSTVI